MRKTDYKNLDNMFINRWSPRAFLEDPIADEDIKTIFEAARWSMSCFNEQPWHFVIITERELLNGIAMIHPYAQMLRHAPSAILVCGDPSLEKHIGYWVQDCAAATENILLEIADQGYGGVWVGVYPREERVREIGTMLSIPHNIIPFALVAVGHPAEKKPPKDVFLEERIRYNDWEMEVGQS